MLKKTRSENDVMDPAPSPVSATGKTIIGKQVSIEGGIQGSEDLVIEGTVRGSVELEKRGDELLVKIGRFRRSLVLPRYLATLQPVWAQIEGHDLKIAFEEPSPKEQVLPDS